MSVFGLTASKPLAACLINHVTLAATFTAPLSCATRMLFKAVNTQIKLLKNFSFIFGSTKMQENLRQGQATLSPLLDDLFSFVESPQSAIDFEGLFLAAYKVDTICGHLTQHHF